MGDSPLSWGERSRNTTANAETIIPKHSGYQRGPVGFSGKTLKSKKHLSGDLKSAPREHQAARRCAGGFPASKEAGGWSAPLAFQGRAALSRRLTRAPEPSRAGGGRTSGMPQGTQETLPGPSESPHRPKGKNPRSRECETHRVFSLNTTGK